MAVLHPAQEGNERVSLVDSICRKWRSKATIDLIMRKDGKVKDRVFD